MSGLRIGRACGKVILLGEHAVVYGVPAIAVGIDRGARATATPLERGPSSLYVRGWDIRVTEDDGDHDLGRALRAVVASAHVAAMAIEAEADLPPGGGLGCSAAIGVAIGRALDADEARVLDHAMAWERVFHGNPSGVDAAVSASGGCVYFKRGDDRPHIEQVNAKGGLTVCVGSTGVASSTRSMVDAVARFRERRPEIAQKSFDAIRSLVQNAKLAIEAGDKIGLGKLMDLNQMILSGLYVSSEEIERMCDAARTAGALGAKLTGAGGGGSVVALVSSNAAAEKVIEAWRAIGFDGFAARVAGVEPRRALVSESSP
jgi:mevalonate kinase